MLLRSFAAFAVLLLADLARPAPAAVSGQELWTAPLAPFRIADNLYYVGSKELTAFLIATHKGLILLDGGVPQNAQMELDNVRALGFDPKDVKILLNSHAHFDHAGVLAAIKQATGAQLVISRGDAPVVESGGEADFFFHKRSFPPAKVDRVIDDGDTVSLGGVTLTAHLTAGHTKGCTSWSLPLTVDGQPKQALFICSLSILSGYRLSGDPAYPNQGADYAHAIATLRAQRCDLFLGAHGVFFDLLKKREAMLAGAKTNPFIDPTGCKAYIDHAAEALAREQRKEAR